VESKLFFSAPTPAQDLFKIAFFYLTNRIKKLKLKQFTKSSSGTMIFFYKIYSSL
jgi:hypothetical protein